MYFNKVDGVLFPIHTLANGLRIAITFGRYHIFSDGTEFTLPEGLVSEYKDAVPAQKIVENIFYNHDPRVKAYATRHKLPAMTIARLDGLTASPNIDVIMVSHEVLDALNDMEADGTLVRLRQDYQKVLAPQFIYDPNTKESGGKVNVKHWIWRQ